MDLSEVRPPDFTAFKDKMCRTETLNACASLSARARVSASEAHGHTLALQLTGVDNCMGLD